jgi:cell division septal protein FtsQ
LRTQPDIAVKAERVIRISERRWTIQLKDGAKLHLPAVGEADALAAIARLDMQSGLLGLGYGEIDARGPQLVLIGRNEAPRSKPATPQSISALIEADRRRSW